MYIERTMYMINSTYTYMNISTISVYIIFTTMFYIKFYSSLSLGGLPPDALQGVTVPIINNSDCETMFRAAGYAKKIPDTFICAGTKDGGLDACKVSILYTYYLIHLLQLVFSQLSCWKGKLNIYDVLI